MRILILPFLVLLVASCGQKEDQRLAVKIYQTTAAGDQLKEVQALADNAAISDTIYIFPEKQFQKITGFGGAFTESSAYLLNQLSEEKRDEIINAYFSKDGADCSLARTHINSCDFSLNHYSYDTVTGDTDLVHFTIQEDLDDLVPFIKQAQAASSDGFKIIASPWTAPPWMKDNQDWEGGHLLAEYYPTWAKYFGKYLKAYQAEGIDIWGITVENEPLGNGENWESMHYTPREMGNFVEQHLGPQLEAEGLAPKILVYDQNRGHELNEWTNDLLTNDSLNSYIDGTAIHWYNSTYDYFPASLNYLHRAAPDKYIIETEGCIDAEVPHWQDDAWYWSQEATDWGWDWAPEKDKHFHPKYVPVYRYARDIIGCLNNWVDGWVDWNMVLDQQGGPNHASNWCIAPVIVDEKTDEVYYTPLYYVMAHFSKFIRPEATRIGIELTTDKIMATAVKNPDGSIAVVVLNMNEEAQDFVLSLEGKSGKTTIPAQALQTIILN